MVFKYDEHNKYHRMLRLGIITAVSLVVFLMIWWAISIIANNAAIPDPWETFAALADLIHNGDLVTGKSLGDYIAASLSKFIQGFLLALVIALPIGLLLGNFKLLREFVTPWIEVLRPNCFLL